MQWRDVCKNIKEKQKARRMYFSEQEDEILTVNLIVLKRLSVFCGIAIVLYILMIELLLPGWRVTSFYLALFIGLAIHMVSAFYITKHRLKYKIFEKVACVSFNLCLFLLLIYIDTLASPTSSQVFCSAFLVIAPTIFIMTISRMIVDQVFFVIVYALFAFRFKELSIAIHDMYAISAGFVLGVISYLIMMDLRLRVNAEVIRFKHFSEIDELTKIKNRRAANEQISDMLAQRKIDNKCALIMLDVDFFKTINDTYGHKVGDQVLVEVAKVLSETFRNNDVVSRFGGDEFMVFVSDFKEEHFLKEKCQEIQKKVQDIMKGRFPVSCSIGISILTDRDHTMDDMIHEADKALYETKERQRGSYSINVIH